MAIEFTDAQLRTASKDLLDSQAQLDILDQQSSQASDGKQDAYNKDKNNKIFYDEYVNIIHQYNIERQAITGNIITEYSESTLISAAKIEAGNLHFPISPPWVKFQPKILSENNGSPFSSVLITEMTAAQESQDAITKIISGFSSTTPFSSSLSDPYTGGNSISVVSGSANPGDIILVQSGGDLLIGEVISSGVGGTCSLPAYTDEPTCLLNSGVWTPNYGITFNIIKAPSGTLPFGSSVTNYHPGFTNAQRTSATSDPVLLYFQEEISNKLSAFYDFLDIEIVALKANDAAGVESAEITTAKNNVQDAIDIYNLFISSPYLDVVNGRYGDIILGQVSASITLRLSQGPIRSNQILSRFGSISQDGSGNVSGTGQFYNLWKWIELRVSKAGGSLNKYYSFDLTTVFLGAVGNSTNNKIDEYSSVMEVYKLASDSNGTYILSMSDATGLSVSDVVTVLDDVTSHGVFNGTIQTIDGNNITLDILVHGITTEATGRVVKKL